MNTKRSRMLFGGKFAGPMLILALLALTLSACEMPEESPEAVADLLSGPNVWIEYPPNGEIFGEGAIPIVVYAAGQGGVGGLSVTVGGQAVPVGELTPLVSDNTLVRADLLWQPPAQGEYRILASAGGAPTSSTFCSVTCESIEQEPDETTATSTVTPTELPFITLAPGESTWTPTPTPADTDTPTPDTESQVEFWAAPPYINEGECTTLNWEVSGSQAVSYEGGTVNASGSQSECPAESRDYQLQVVEMDGSTSDYWVSVDVYQVDEPTPTNTPYSESSAEFWAAPPYINSGECTTLNWNVYGDFQAVYFEGNSVGASGSDSECPAETYTYNLQVVEMDGSTTDHWASVEVSEPPPEPPTDTPTPTEEPPPADTSGPSINWTNGFLEACQFFGQAGITDESGVSWAQFYYNKNGEGWNGVWMQEISADNWESEVGVMVSDDAVTIEYYVVASDRLGNESESGTASFVSEATGCGGY